MRNKLYKGLIILLFMIAGFLSTVLLSCQEISDPEAEFARIRSIAFEGKYSEAESAARKLLKEYPAYGDARILLGRLLAWQKDYKQALSVIDTLLLTEPSNQDALSAKRDITLWAKESSPVATDIRAGYYFDTFSVPYSRFWQVFSTGAGHRFDWGPAYAGINVGNAIIGGISPRSAVELQFEANAFPRLSDRNYAYLAYAYSPGSYFPRHRAAAEIWQLLSKGWGLSAGLNYYYFDRNIFIALASVEKYVGKYWLSLRSFFYFKDEGITTSFYANIRRYTNSTDYFQVTLGTGTAPDEPFDVEIDLMRLSAHSVRLAYNAAITPKLMIRVGAGYSREEYDESLWRDRFEGGINLTYAIKMK